MVQKIIILITRKTRLRSEKRSRVILPTTVSTEAKHMQYLNVRKYRKKKKLLHG